MCEILGAALRSKRVISGPGRTWLSAFAVEPASDDLVFVGVEQAEGRVCGELVAAVALVEAREGAGAPSGGDLGLVERLVVRAVEIANRHVEVVCGGQQTTAKRGTAR